MLTVGELASNKPLKLLQSKVEDYYKSSEGGAYCHPIAVKPEPTASDAFLPLAKRVKTVTPATAQISTPPQTSPAAEAMAVSIGLRDSYAAVAKQLNFSPQLNAADSIHQRKLLQEAMGEKSANLPSPTNDPSNPGPHIQVLRDARRKKFESRKELSRAYWNGLNTHFQMSNFASSAAAETGVKMEPADSQAVTDMAVSKKTKKKKRKPTKAFAAKRLAPSSARRPTTKPTVKNSSVAPSKKFMIDSSPLITFSNQQKIDDIRDLEPRYEDL